MQKILKPYTIIPSALYVQRDADNQVKNIIDDMGRPGYVLVSRQMGKTNLLLNAKRNFEIGNNIFVYVDLSNSFENVNSCFENIIDTALDSYYDKFKHVSQLIHELRLNIKNTPPHKQHTNELLLLLKALDGGKMVIMLDEIDALTKTNYSDQIFSQIRSSYFGSRVNHSEFYNLTYLLSGVIEPNEIIKDPKISPFNIGQKIYLDDFSKSEFENFIAVSRLLLDKELKDRIYFWTNGNPRISWDICSEIENQIISGQIITIEKIDKIVDDLYLTTYDKPPIDNIRELVKEDRELRNSIIEIEYKKDSEISDRIKSKLYLSGIINYNDKNIHIKNEILKKSLSLEWIKSLEEEEKGLVRMAIDQFEDRSYEESLNTFEKYLSTNTFNESEKSMYYFYMGLASYRVNNYVKTVQYLSNTNFNAEDENRQFYRTKNILGLAYYYLGSIEESLKIFKQVIESGRKDEIYARALLIYGSILRSDVKKYKEEAQTIFNDIIQEKGYDSTKLSSKFINDIKSISYFNLAQINIEEHHRNQAINNFELAVELSVNSKKPGMLLALLDVQDNPDDKIKTLNVLIDFIIENNVKPIDPDPENPIDFSSDDLKEVLINIFLNYNDLLFEKSKPLFDLLQLPFYEGLYQLSIYAVSKKDLNSTKKLLLYIYKAFDNNENPVDEKTKYQILKLLSYFNFEENIAIKYCEVFSFKRFEKIDYLDFEIFASQIYKLVQAKKYYDALKYVKIINDVKSEVGEADVPNYLVILNLELNIYFYLNDRKNTILKAEEIINLIDNENLKNYKSDLLGETGKETIRQNAESILRPEAKIQTPLVSGKKYGRNEIVKVRYKNGNIVESKFKKVENDLQKQECYILNQ